MYYRCKDYTNIINIVNKIYSRVIFAYNVETILSGVAVGDEDLNKRINVTNDH